MFVPVVDKNQEPLMPTTSWRASKWITTGKATPFWKKGVFCVRLNTEPSNNKTQEVAVGIDPGSKKEGFTIKSNAHTYLNIQADAVQWVRKVIEQRRNARRVRRFRNTPCRKPRWNRASLKKNRVPPSTKARWQWKIRVLNWLKKLFPITEVIVEDIKAKTTGKRRWDKSFSPLQVGKEWFYDQIENLTLIQGWETKELRDQLGLKKSSKKLSNDFNAHCVDSWVMANSIVGGHKYPENTSMMLLTPMQFHRRQLHVFQPSKGGKRRDYGGTISIGFKRGSLVKHKKHVLAYIGGTSKDKVSLHSITTGVRLCQNAKVEDLKFKTYLKWRVAFLPHQKGRGFLPQNL